MSDREIALDELLAAIDAELPRAIELRHALHRTPELGFREHATAAAVEDALAPLAARRVLETGLIVRVGSEHARPVVLRAELDGLPIAERTGAAHAACNGAMHACGHDVHMAALVVLLRALHHLSPSPRVPLVGLFQPSEEVAPSGASALAQELGDTLRARALGAVHVHPDIPFGHVAVDGGPINAACDDLELVVRGREAHAGYPQQARDPVLALAGTIVALQQLVSRRTDPLHAAVLSITRVEAGAASNVIPAEAQAWGTLRTLEPQQREAARQMVAEIAEHTAAAHGCVADVRFSVGEPALVNDRELAARAPAILRAAGLQPSASFRSCGSDDFAFLAALGPALMAFAGVHGAQEVADVPLHDARFMPRDDAVALVARSAACLYLAGAAVGSEPEVG